MSSKTLLKEFQFIEEKLKNRDIGAEELKTLASEKLLNKLVKVYENHKSLWVEAARIILQLYSHYPIRYTLYAKKESGLCIG